jgi:ATP-dependent Clp protease ATP-binding subunit ClpB
VDDIVLFKPLTLAEIKEIISLLTLDLSRRLKDRRIELRISDSARDFIAQAGFDPVYGARPLKRYLQHQLETRIGRALISGSIPDGSTILVDVQDGDLVVNHTQ